MSGFHESRMVRKGFLFGGALTLVLSWSMPATAQQQPPQPPPQPPQQMTPEQAAEMTLNSARQAYNEKNYPVAVVRFREFLTKFAAHKDVPSARYGLALALLESPEKDYPAAAAELVQIVENKALPEHPFAQYYLGQAQRGLGTRELAEALAKPQEAPQRRTQAGQHFTEAANRFAAAEAAFAVKVKPPAANVKELPADLEWAARARCDLAEMQLRTLKTKEAQATTAPFVKDPLWSKSKSRNLGLYYHGFASLLLNDGMAAGKSLNQLTPFDDPVFGNHARYLLARAHHQSDERAEAAGHYEGTLGDYAKRKQAAVEAIKKPEQFKNNPEELARLTRLAQEPSPDYIARAAFFLGVLRYEEGKFADALARFADFAKNYPTSPLVVEAQLRQGFCHVQLKQYKEALDVLQPLAQKEARLADQAFLWIGKAQVGAADPNNAQTYAPALAAAIQTFRTAAERAQVLTATDPDAKTRRAEILLEMADSHQLAKQYKEAAATYAQIIQEKNLPQREEEVLQRQITALHLAGDYAASDAACVQFRQAHPKSPLLAMVLFRHAENAYFMLQAMEKTPPTQPNRAQEIERLNTETINRYKEVVEKYPNFPLINLARYGLALLHYRRGEIEPAQKALAAIPAANRSGELALASYLLADCLIRQTPTKADDALTAAKAKERLETAVQALDAFLAAQPTAPQAPDALLKLGFCHQRLAALLAQPADQTKALTNARAAYEKLIQQLPAAPQMPQAVLERAKCLAQSGDAKLAADALTELQRFNAAPLNAAPIAPLALLQWATILRGQNKPADAAAVLAQCRQQHEANLLKDPARAEWVLVLQYQHGITLREAGKLAEARAVFDQLTKQATGKPEAYEAALRFAQCLKEEGVQKVEAARKMPTAKPEEQAAAKQALDAGLKDVRDAVQYLETQINQLRTQQPAWEVRSRLLYEAAWACRFLAGPEVADARAKVQQELLKKLQEEAAKKAPPGTPSPAIPLPDVPLAQVPLQPAEQKIRAFYDEILTSFPEMGLAGEVRFELAELHVERVEFDAAMKLLEVALEQEVDAKLADMIRLRMGECLAAKGDAKGAIAHFEAVANNPKSSRAGEGHYYAGEYLMRQKEYAKATAHLAVFRDQPAFQNLPGLSDKALLRLGHALALQSQWELSRQAFEMLVSRFPSSPWFFEAHYGIGWAWQNLKSYENAVKSYSLVVAGIHTEVAAKAQLQIGLCLMEQKKYADAANALMVVPYTYAYDEPNAAALCEAARAFIELKQKDQAAKLLNRVIEKHPKSQWAAVAKQRLKEVEKGG